MSDPVPVTRLRVAGAAAGIALLIAIVSIVVLTNLPDRTPGASDSGVAAIGGATGPVAPSGAIGSGPAGSRPVASPGATPGQGAAPGASATPIVAAGYPRTA